MIRMKTIKFLIRKIAKNLILRLNKIFKINLHKKLFKINLLNKISQINPHWRIFFLMIYIRILLKIKIHLKNRKFRFLHYQYHKTKI
jgi:hypothetical protein